MTTVGKKIFATNIKMSDFIQKSVGRFFSNFLQCMQWEKNNRRREKTVKDWMERYTFSQTKKFQTKIFLPYKIFCPPESFMAFKSLSFQQISRADRRSVDFLDVVLTTCKCLDWFQLLFYSSYCVVKNVIIILSKIVVWNGFQSRGS